LSVIHDVSDYVTWNIAPPQFYIKDLLPKDGSLLLYGEPGVMKSWMAEQMGFCIATGQPFLGFDVEQARTLIINFEISSHSYHWRLKDMSTRFEVQPQFFYELSENMLFINEDDNFNYLMEKMRPYAPRVIILDCMSAFFGGDENKSDQIGKLWFNVRAMQSEFNASVIIIHHDNKNVLATGMARIRGHTKLPGYVDTVIYMVKQPTCRQLQFLKTRQSRREYRSFNVFFEDYLWVRHDQQED